VERFAAVHERLNQVKGERALGLADAVAGILSTLPTPIIVRLARQQVETVDFACSNVRGAPFDLFIAGARVLSNHPMGPTAGTAFNVTLLSYLDHMDMGLNIDTAAVPDGTLLRDCLRDGIDEVIAAGT
jgi:diacylglycerol O-acyltransferase